ncbi:MAG: hypothetical protein SVU32_08950 [Candidatus Nanohaloarchaea archaeon]|nr:hypothetical protein [Candidatus Nanohaloarchaea archaeon]
MSSIRDDAADLGYHDELALEIEYTWEEEREGQDQPVSNSVRWHKRSKEHAVDALLWSDRVDEDERQETVERAIKILEAWNHGDYDESEADFSAWTREEIPTSDETRTLDLDASEDADVKAYLREQDEAMKDMDAANYCRRIVTDYIDGHIDHELWHEKPNEVADILRRNDEEFLADAVDTYAQQPELIVGRNVYEEEVAPEEASTPEEYLEGLEKERFQPI